jgi:ketosteroid isomerase-like protein
MRKVLAMMAIVAVAGCGEKAAEQDAAAVADDAAAHLAHENYVAAINSNNVDSIAGMLTDDIVFMASGFPVMEGKKQVLPWVEGYLQTFKTHWDKPVQEFVVCGEWAFERYTYHSTDTALADGSVFEDTGWGLLIYYHDADGKWRVARDAWGPDHPPAE